MAVIREHYKDRQEWLEARKKLGIGGSEAASVLGLGYTKTMDLWSEKVGEKKHADLSGNARVQFGNDAEPLIRRLFALMNTNYLVVYEPLMTLRRDDVDWMFYSPDGELYDESDNGRYGLLEIKTATPLRKSDWDKWNERIPTNYLCQIEHGMYVTGAQYTNLAALIRKSDGDAEIRVYHFERSDYEEDIEYLAEKERVFWECVKEKRVPPVPIPM